MNIRILTDSAAELTKDEIQKDNVIVMQMPMNYDNQEFYDMPIEDFWQVLISGKVVRTSQPSRELMKQEFLKAKQEGYALVCIFISAKFSGTLETAQNLKQEVGYDQIYIVDSLTATISEKVIVKEAIKLTKQNLTAEQIVSRLNEFAKKVRIVACLDTLTYLARGGRINRAIAAIGNLIKIKPIIDHKDGKIRLIGKKIGLNMALKEVVKICDFNKIDTNYDIIPIFAHDNTNTSNLVKLYKETYPEAKLVENTSIGPVVGTHIGPGGFGFVYVEK